MHFGAPLLVFPQVPFWMGTAIFPDGLDPRLILATLRWVESHWWLGMGVWHAPWLYPNPWALAFSDHLLGLVPLFAILRRLFDSEAAAYGVVFLASYGLCSWGTARLLERLGSRSIAAHLLGFAVAYAPWRTDQIPHLQMLWQPALPWLFMAFDRLLARPGPRRLAGFLGWYLVHVSAGSYLAYLAHLLLGIQFGVRLGRARRRLLRPAALVWLVVTPLAAGLVALPFFWPYLEARKELGLVRPAWEIERYGASAVSWLAPARRSAYVDFWPQGWVREERALFPGFFLASTALIGLVTLHRSRRPLTSLELSLLIGGVTFAVLAHAKPFLLLARFLPGLDGMRVPTRGAPFVLLALGVLGARGLETVLRISGELATTRARGLAMAVLAGLLLAPDLWPRRFADWERVVVERPEDLLEVDRSLSRLSGVRGVAILPVPGGVEATREMLRAAHHGKPIGAGHAGYLPQSVRALRYHCRYPERQVDHACFGALQELGFSHLIVRDEGLRGPLSAGEVWGRVGSVLDPAVAQGFELLAWDEASLLFRLRIGDGWAE